MNRRELIGGLTAALVVSGARADQPIHQITLLDPFTAVADLNAQTGPPWYRGLFEELARLGYIEGKNLRVDRFSAEGRGERLEELARDVVARNPSLIFTPSTRVIFALKSSGTRLPIVGIIGDPVKYGFVASLAHPGGNITGVAVEPGNEFYEKRVAILKELVPKAARVGVVLPGRSNWEKNPAAVASWQGLEERLGVTFIWPYFGQAEYRRAFDEIMKEGADAIVVHESNENWTERKVILQLAAKTHLPTIYPWFEYVKLGGLMSYGFDPVDWGIHAAEAISKIFKETKPGDIPIYQPVKVDLSINLRVATDLGIVMPPSLVIRANNVLE